MPESETAKKITKVVKLADKMLVEIVRNTQKLVEALRELKEKDEKKE